MVIQVGEKWCKATTTWKFWWNFLAKSLIFSRYPSFSPFQRPDAYKCYTFSESCGSRETREIKISTSKFDLEARGILSSLWTQTGPWSDTASYVILEIKFFQGSCDGTHGNRISFLISAVGLRNLWEVFEVFWGIWGIYGRGGANYWNDIFQICTEMESFSSRGSSLKPRKGEMALRGKTWGKTGK